MLKRLSTAMDSLDENSTFFDYITTLGSVLVTTKTQPIKDFGKLSIPGQKLQQGGTQGLTDAVNAPPPMSVPDLYIPGADGNRNYITGPAGTFQLHAQDSIIAGTDLGSGGISPQDLQKAVAAGMATALKAASSNSRSRPIEVSLDGRVVGRAVMDEMAKQMSPVIPL